MDFARRKLIFDSPLAGWAFTFFIRDIKIYGAHEYFVFVLIKKVADYAYNQQIAEHGRKRRSDY